MQNIEVEKKNWFSLINKHYQRYNKPKALRILTFNTFSSNHTLLQALKSWSNLRPVLFGKVRDPKGLVQLTKV